MELGPRSKHSAANPKAMTSHMKSKAGVGGKKPKNTSKRPVKTVQIIRKVEYSSSLQEELPTNADGSAAIDSTGEAKKKCILLIVKKNKDENNNNTEEVPMRKSIPRLPTSSRRKLSLEPTVTKPPGKGRYVKVRKEALQSLPELRELINFHRSKHAELIQENQLYDSSLGEKLSLPIVSLPQKKVFQDAPKTYSRPPVSLPKGPGYLVALNPQDFKVPELWPPLQNAPTNHHVAPSLPIIQDVKENIPVKEPSDNLKGIVLHRGENFPVFHPPAVQIWPPSLMDYENVTVLENDPEEDPALEDKVESRAKKVLEEFDFLNSWEPICDPVEEGYVPNCPDFDLKSLEVERAGMEDGGTVLEEPPLDPFLEEMCRIVWREPFDPFQQPQRQCSTSSVSGSKVSEPQPKPEKSPQPSNAAALRWKCKLCGEKHATKNSLITHLKLHQQPFCPICLAVVSSPKKLRVHTLKAHPADARQELLSVDGVIVTSKYGRRRAVLDAATLCGRKRFKSRNSI